MIVVDDYFAVLLLFVAVQVVLTYHKMMHLLNGSQ